MRFLDKRAAHEAESDSLLPMSSPDLNWLDKTILSICRFRIGITSEYNVYAVKILLSVSTGLYILSILGVLNELQVVPSKQAPVEGWVVVTSLFALSYIPIHLFTHSAKEILSCDISKREKWGYALVGLLLIAGWGLLLVWPVPVLLGR